MLKNKIVVRKIRNIVILLMAIIIMFGAYKNIDKSKAEEVIEISAIAIDNYSCLENEEFILEAKEISDGLYEIEIPENINSKIVNNIINVKLTNENTTDESENIEIIDNKIKLTKEQIDNKQISFETVYDVAVTVIDEEGKYSKKLLSEMTEEEITEVKTTTEGNGLLYKRILKYEENETTVEVKGYMLEDVELDIQEVTQEQLSEIYGEKQIDFAYNIKTIRKIEKQADVEQTEGEEVKEKQVEGEQVEGEQAVITEIIEISPVEYGEIFEVSIIDSKIEENSEVYYWKDENTYNQLGVNENTVGNIKFNMYDSGIYAVKQQQLSFVTGTTAENLQTEVGAGTENEGTTTGWADTPAKSEANAYARRFFTVVSGTWLHNVNSSTSYVGVKKIMNEKGISTYKVEYICWSDSYDTPTTWKTAETENHDDVGGMSDYYYFAIPSSNNKYLHVKQANGSTYFGGPYNFGTIDSAGVSAGFATTGAVNYTGATVNVKSSSGETLTNSSVRAKWVRYDFPYPYKESALDGDPIKEVTSVTETHRKHSVGVPSEMIHVAESGAEAVYPVEGLFYLRYKYWGITNTGASAAVYGCSGPVPFDYVGPSTIVYQGTDRCG